MKQGGLSGSDRTRQTTQKVSDKTASKKAGSFEGKTVTNTAPATITPAPQQTSASSGPRHHSSIKSVPAQSVTPSAVPPPIPDLTLDKTLTVTSRMRLASGPLPESLIKLEDKILRDQGGTFQDLAAYKSEAAKTGKGHYRVSSHVVNQHLRDKLKSGQKADSFFPLDLDKAIDDYERKFANFRASILAKGGTFEEMQEFQQMCEVFGLELESLALPRPEMQVAGPEIPYITPRVFEEEINRTLRGNKVSGYQQLAFDPKMSWQDLSRWQAIWMSGDHEQLSILTPYLKFKAEVLPDLEHANEEKVRKLSELATEVASVTGTYEDAVTREKVGQRLAQIEKVKAVVAEHKLRQKNEQREAKQTALIEAKKAEEQRKKEETEAKLQAEEQKAANLTIPSALDEKQLHDEKAPELATPTPDIQKKERNTESERPRWYLPPRDPPKVNEVFQPTKLGGFTLTEQSKTHILEAHRAGNKHIAEKSQFPALKQKQILKGIEAVANSSEGQWNTSATDDEKIIKLGKMELGDKSSADWDGTIAVVAVAKTQEIVTAYPLNLRESNLREQ